MKNLIIIALFMLFAWNGFGQETIVSKNSNGIIESVEFSLEDKSIKIPASAEAFFKEMLKVKPTDEFRKLIKKDNLLSSSTASNAAKPYTIQVWSESLGLVRIVNNAAQIQQVSLQGLAPSTYYVHIIVDGDTVSKKTLVKK